MGDCVTCYNPLCAIFPLACLQTQNNIPIEEGCGNLWSSTPYPCGIVPDNPVGDAANFLADNWKIIAILGAVFVGAYVYNSIK